MRRTLSLNLESDGDPARHQRRSDFPLDVLPREETFSSLGSFCIQGFKIALSVGGTSKATLAVWCSTHICCHISTRGTLDVFLSCRWKSHVCLPVGYCDLGHGSNDLCPEVIEVASPVTRYRREAHVLSSVPAPWRSQTTKTLSQGPRPLFNRGSNLCCRESSRGWFGQSTTTIISTHLR